jgi:hypothetical protein
MSCGANCLPFPKGSGGRSLAGKVSCFTSLATTTSHIDKSKIRDLGFSSLPFLQNPISQEAYVHAFWLVRTFIVFQLVFLMPVPMDIGNTFKAGVAAALMCTLVLHEGFREGSQVLGSEVRQGSGDLGYRLHWGLIGAGATIGAGLFALALSNVFFNDKKK